MKLYVVCLNNITYNDEWYSHDGIEAPVKGYRSKEKAEAECERLEKEYLDKWGWCREEEDGTTLNNYCVLEMEVDQEELV